jgi:hypothetical protein
MLRLTGTVRQNKTARSDVRGRLAILSRALSGDRCAHSLALPAGPGVVGIGIIIVIHDVPEKEKGHQLRLSSRLAAL